MMAAIGRNSSYYRPLLNIFLDIVVLLTDTYNYCLSPMNIYGNTSLNNS